jgi:hypothetical protein
MTMLHVLLQLSSCCESSVFSDVTKFLRGVCVTCLAGTGARASTAVHTVWSARVPTINWNTSCFDLIYIIISPNQVPRGQVESSLRWIGGRCLASEAKSSPP